MNIVIAVSSRRRPVRPALSCAGALFMAFGAFGLTAQPAEDVSAVLAWLQQGLGPRYAAFIAENLTGAHRSLKLLTPAAMDTTQQSRCRIEMLGLASGDKPLVCGSPKPFLVSPDLKLSWVRVGDMHPLLSAAAIVHSAGFRTRSQNEDLRTFYRRILGLKRMSAFETHLAALWPDQRTVLAFQRSGPFFADEVPVLTNNSRNRRALDQAGNSLRAMLKAYGVEAFNSSAETSMIRASVIAIRRAAIPREFGR